MTLFNGILYHLPDPIAGLRLAADLTNDILVIGTEIMPGGPDGLVMNPESATEVISGIDGLAWLPTSERVVRELLAWCGFPHAQLRFDISSVRNWRRIQLIAARHAETLAPA